VIYVHDTSQATVGEVGLRVGFVAAAAAFLAGAAPAAVPGVPAIYVDYSTSCTFTLTVDPGTTIAPTGTALPPGTYQLLTAMPNPSSGFPCGKPDFTLTGPGVDVSIVFAGVELRDERLLALQPSSSYTAEDETAPGDTRRVFTTTATGSSSSLVQKTATTTTAAGGDEQTDIVGSAIVPYRGKLAASVSAAGKAALRLGRAPLEAGRYDIQVADADRRAGLYLRHATGRPVTISTAPFVGRKTRRVTLTAGRWVYFSAAGRVTTFTVVS
jgi:hypothetical protein